jgi:hypothetical protein
MKEIHATPPQAACRLTPSTRQHFAGFALAEQVPSQTLAGRGVVPQQLDASGHIRDFDLCVLLPAEPYSANGKYKYHPKNATISKKHAKGSATRQLHDRTCSRVKHCSRALAFSNEKHSSAPPGGAMTITLPRPVSDSAVEMDRPVNATLFCCFGSIFSRTLSVAIAAVSPQAMRTLPMVMNFGIHLANMDLWPR